MANILMMIRRRGEGGRALAAWLVVVVIHGGEIERAREGWKIPTEEQSALPQKLMIGNMLPNRPHFIDGADFSFEMRGRFFITSRVLSVTMTLYDYAVELLT